MRDSVRSWLDAMGALLLEAVALECTRRERVIFSRLALRAEPGTLVQVVGPNGSGKTSLLRLLCGLSLPSHGEVRWCGQNIRTMKEDYWRQLAYVGHLDGVKDDLTAFENLRLSAAIAGRRASAAEARAALLAIGLDGCTDSFARHLSQGQRRRLALARVILSRQTPLWLLDEPFSALDAGGVAVLRTCIAEHLAAGCIVVMTAHAELPVTARRTTTVTLGGPEAEAA